MPIHNSAFCDSSVFKSNVLSFDSELVSKISIMDRYNYKQAVAIGDGVTDISMAARADLVFARDNLCRYLDQKSLPYQTWDSFFDIRDALARKWKQH